MKELKDKLKALEELLKEIKEDVKTNEDLEALNEVLKNNTISTDDTLIPYYSTVIGLFTNRTFTGQPRKTVEEADGFLEPGDEVYAYIPKKLKMVDITAKQLVWLPVDSKEYERLGACYTTESFNRDMQKAREDKDHTRDVMISPIMSSLWSGSKK